MSTQEAYEEYYVPHNSKLPIFASLGIFLTLFGMGSTRSKPGSEMAAIRAANLLMNQDPHGGAWIAFNKEAETGEPAAARGGRRGGGRRRRA